MKHYSHTVLLSGVDFAEQHLSAVGSASGFSYILFFHCQKSAFIGKMQCSNKIIFDRNLVRSKRFVRLFQLTGTLISVLEEMLI